MASKFAREKAAQAWCFERTKTKVMDPELCEAFATVLDEYMGSIGMACCKCNLQDKCACAFDMYNLQVEPKIDCLAAK